MTVSSLWKSLNKAGSGKSVGAEQLADPSGFKRLDRLNRTCNDIPAAPGRPPTLAVDLSIWVCESLTSHCMNEQHANPTLHLVFTRTMKLLQLGIRLIFVIEGKQRIRDFTNEEADKFRKRRSGTAFWKACNDCQQLLELLGVLVVRAKSEGEALCALLNARGIVDGVISNDGDCLLFGAKVIYTKYSNENLDNNRVMRYDLDGLYAMVDASDEPDIAASEVGTLKLSRYDLVSFALLTGSDLAGSGLEKVGHKKAIRFIRKCQLDNPLSAETASLDEIKAWANAATANVPHHDETGKKCCSRCTHVGSKRGHEKHGCELCGTGPGEPCHLFTSDDRFRRSLRAKALALRPKFDPSKVCAAYMRPNENQLPMLLIGASRNGDQTKSPQLSALMQMPLIVRGHSLEGSRAYVRQAVVRLLSRSELHRVEPTTSATSTAHSPQAFRDQPVPKQINKALTRNQVPCYEIAWVVNATATDANGDGVDGYEYVTVEPRELIQQKYPNLIAAFRKAEVERAKQGDGMKNKRQKFLENFLFPAGEVTGNPTADDRRKWKKRRSGLVSKKREKYFNTMPPPPREYQAKKRMQRRQAKQHSGGGDDVGNLLRFVCKPLETSPAKTTLLRDTGALNNECHERVFQQLVPSRNADRNPTCLPYTPSVRGQTPDPRKHLFCAMGGFVVEITPLESNRGEYPPKHIFVNFLDGKD